MDVSRREGQPHALSSKCETDRFKIIRNTIGASKAIPYTYESYDLSHTSTYNGYDVIFLI